MRVLLTGATGFVGRCLSERLVLDNVYELQIAIRSQSSRLIDAVNTVIVEDVGPDTQWKHALDDVQVVVHAAARAHILQDSSADPLAEFRHVNTAGTENLARQAVNAGVKRFVFLSSVGVNGCETFNQAFCENTEPNPHSPYALSKWEAEIELLKLAREKGMEVVIIRPPLVYGPRAPGNFGKLLRFVAKGIPLPLGAIHNKRSLVALDNLVDFIVTCIDHPAAANQTFLVSDGEDMSTTQLLQRTSAALGKTAHLLPVPPSLLASCLKILGKGDLAQRLCGSLQVDISKAKSELVWTPPISVEEGIRKTAEWFKKNNE